MTEIKMASRMKKFNTNSENSKLIDELDEYHTKLTKLVAHIEVNETSGLRAIDKEMSEALKVIKDTRQEQLCASSKRRSRARLELDKVRKTKNTMTIFLIHSSYFIHRVCGCQ